MAIVDPAPDFRGSDIVDHSGTVTAGGADQIILAANPNRNFLLIQNVSDTDMWVNFGAVANSSQPSVFLAKSGGAIILDTWVTRLAVHLFCATTGKAFTAKEG